WPDGSAAVAELVTGRAARPGRARPLGGLARAPGLAVRRRARRRSSSASGPGAVGGAPGGPAADRPRPRHGTRSAALGAAVPDRPARFLTWPAPPSRCRWRSACSWATASRTAAEGSARERLDQPDAEVERVADERRAADVLDVERRRVDRAAELDRAAAG